MPSRLIGHRLRVRLYDDRLEVFQGAHASHRPCRAGAPRPNGKHGHVVDYRHVIHSLRRKPMALLNLVYRDQLFPRARLCPRLRRAARRAPARRQPAASWSACSRSPMSAPARPNSPSRIEADLDAGRLPDLAALTERFAPEAAAAPNCRRRAAAARRLRRARRHSKERPHEGERQDRRRPRRPAAQRTAPVRRSSSSGRVRRDRRQGRLARRPLPRRARRARTRRARPAPHRATSRRRHACRPERRSTPSTSTPCR